MSTFDLEEFDRWFWAVFGEDVRKKAQAMMADGWTGEVPRWVEQLNRLRRDALAAIRGKTGDDCDPLPATAYIRWVPVDDDDALPRMFH